jgi:hypothetical protein
MLVMKKPFPQNGKGFKRSPDGDASLGCQREEAAF